MHSIANYIQAGFWFAVFVAWAVYNRRLMAWIEVKVARPTFNTNPQKTASVMYRVIACVLLYLSLDNVFDGVRRAKFERIVETIATNAAEQQATSAEQPDADSE